MKRDFAASDKKINSISNHWLQVFIFASLNMVEKDESKVITYQVNLLIR